MAIRLDLTSTSALVGLSIVEVINVYRETAPSLHHVRMSPPGDFLCSQGLLDAEVLGGIAAVLLGGTASVLTKGPLPLLLSAVGLLLITQYYRSVLRSPNPPGGNNGRSDDPSGDTVPS